MTPIIDVKDVTSMSDQQRVHLRRETVTYIFESFSLLPGLSAAENVGVPLRIAGVAPKAREERVATMLTLVGLAGHARHRPGELSQPTGQLDAETGKQIMRLLRAVVRSEGVTALLGSRRPLGRQLLHDIQRVIDVPADVRLRAEDVPDGTCAIDHVGDPTGQ
jgi:putative ABC transport system ATP-binding protein